MSFRDLISKIENDTEERQMNLELHKRRGHGIRVKPFEAAGYIMEVTARESREVPSVVRLALQSTDGDQIILPTIQTEEYYADCIGKKVVLAGLMTEADDHPVLYVSSCYSIEGRENLLDTCRDMDEHEKRAFQKKIQEFSPLLQNDLTRKRLRMKDRGKKSMDKEIPASYISMEEMEVLYDILEPMIPMEFRAEYYNCKQMQEKELSNSEKRNCIKVISNILSIDWIEQYYKEIDVEEACKKLKAMHIGHQVQLEELRTQMLTCNQTRKAPKTLNFVGRSCGCGSLAAAFAKAIGRKYAEIDLSGRQTKESEPLTGSSRIYENGKCGYLFERIMEVGPYGMLIIKNIDTYNAGTLDVITGLIQKKPFKDGFMEIPVDLSNLWIICTASTTKGLPMSLRKATYEILFSKLTEQERIRAINEVILPGQCAAYGLACRRKISGDVCRKLIYQISHNEPKKIEMNIEALVVKALAEGKKEFPQMNKTLLKRWLRYEDDQERACHEYATDLMSLENKFFQLYDRYPVSSRERINDLLDDIRYSDDTRMETYAIHALRYIVNPTLGQPFAYEAGEVEKAMKKMRCGQDYLARQVDDALMAEKLSGNRKRMTVIGLGGPPGTGKTSAAEIIAKVLDRNLIKISFAGASDSSIIKGKNKMVPNAGPGTILKKLARKNGTYHDVINIDEVDKGTPEAYEALHEFLDPETEFYYDEYLEYNVPKNNFLVILTFNDITRIPRPILDRMRVIFVDGYTISDKKEIARNAVMKRFRERMGLEKATISDEALTLLMRDYAVTPGIRDLEMDIEKLFVRMIKKEEKMSEISITEADVRRILGYRKTLGLNDMGNKRPIPGQAIALAVSGNMGSCIAIQVVEDPYQKENVEVSGLMEGSCRESLSDAMSYARRTLKKELPKLHISFRDPSVKKDGASAGLALYMAIMSCLLGKDLGNCAFTGTIDAFGNVGAVGVKEKLIAAEREGLEAVYIPRDNYDELEETQMLDKFRIEIVPVRHVDELTRVIFERGAA